MRAGTTSRARRRHRFACNRNRSRPTTTRLARRSSAESHAAWPARRDGTPPVPWVILLQAQLKGCLRKLELEHRAEPDSYVFVRKPDEEVHRGPMKRLRR